MSQPGKPVNGLIGPMYRGSRPSWPEERSAPKGAPNVVLIVLDDVGFADLGCYGSEIATPHMDGLAANGLRYSNFHVTSMCSPTRACLLTGRNSHAAGMGVIAEWSSGYPGYTGEITQAAATIPEVLRDHAYGTYAVGKWHLTNIAHYGSAGPHDSWPLARGFSRWYGFHGSLADHWNPELYQDNRPIQLAADDTRHLSADLVDHAIGDIRDHVSCVPHRPFLLYLAFGACHFPLHAPREYIDAYRGRYDIGWDAVRARRLQKQLATGVVPSGTKLAPLNPGITPWRDLSRDVQVLCARLQETYAGFLEHTDAQIGRLVEYLAGLDKLDDTLIILLSDNGASSEGGATGAFNLRKHIVYEQEAPAVGLSRLEEIGGPRSFPHYPAGWAQVSNTPLKWYKRNTYGGGVRAPLILHWPRRVTSRGAVRTQFHHAIDIAPTIYEILGIEAPAQYRGMPQIPVHGTSLAYTFEGDGPTRKRSQYFELVGDRAMWASGWKAVARHQKGADFSADPWRLYHLDRDFAELNDLSAEHPDTLHKLINLWWSEAREYGVLPLDDRDWERTADHLKMSTRTRYEYFGAMARTDRLSVPDIGDRSYMITATFESDGDVEGIILAWGSLFGGFVLYIDGGRLCYEYVYSDALKHTMSAPLPQQPGKRSIELAFGRTGVRTGRARLAIDGTAAAAVDIPLTWPVHGTTAGLNCGHNPGAPVSDAYERPFPFTGQCLRVVMELDRAVDHDGGSAYRAVIKEQ